MTTPRPPSLAGRNRPPSPAGASAVADEPKGPPWRVIGLTALIVALVVFATTMNQGSDAEEPTETFRSSIPTIPDDRRQAFIRELDLIAPGLASEPEDSVTNSRNTCQSALRGSTNLLEQTKIRFVGDGVESMTSEQAQKIINLIRAEPWCR